MQLKVEKKKGLNENFQFIDFVNIQNDTMKTVFGWYTNFFLICI